MVLSYVLASLYGASAHGFVPPFARQSTYKSYRAHQLYHQLVKAGFLGVDCTQPQTLAAIQQALICGGFAAEAYYLSGTHSRSHHCGLDYFGCQDGSVLGAGVAMVQSGQVITLGCNSYPQQLRYRMGVAAPAVMYCQHIGTSSSSSSSSGWAGGVPPWQGAGTVGGVGSRVPSASVRRIVKAYGHAAQALGFTLVSGGAAGCDTEFCSEGGQMAVHLLPHGLFAPYVRPKFNGVLLSVCHPLEPFSASRAMQRNALIYALSDTTLVFLSRFKQGGTWAGATSALRSGHPVAVLCPTRLAACARPPAALVPSTNIAESGCSAATRAQAAGRGKAVTGTCFVTGAHLAGSTGNSPRASDWSNHVTAHMALQAGGARVFGTGQATPLADMQSLHQLALVARAGAINTGLFEQLATAAPGEARN